MHRTEVSVEVRGFNVRCVFVCAPATHFRYSDPRLCELVVGRMGRVVLPLMSAAAHGVSDDLADTEVDTSRAQDASIFLHVGHDVTIVPLLYALGGWQADHGWCVDLFILGVCVTRNRPSFTCMHWVLCHRPLFVGQA